METDYQKGKLYQWNGTEFSELEPSSAVKLPVTEEAADAVKGVRKQAQTQIGMRPELSLTASAMLCAAAQLPDMPERVKAYGLSIYSADRRPASKAIQQEVAVEAIAVTDAPSHTATTSATAASVYLDERATEESNISSTPLSV